MKHTDPVCGMQVDENTSHKSQHGGETIYFCSAGCKQKFDKNPEAYRKKSGGMKEKNQESTMSNATHDGMNQNHYRRLLVMTVVSFVAMYILMYAMVDRLANVVPNFNQFYMAGLMTAPMVIIELLVMRGMYHSKRLNAVLVAASALALAVFFVFIRQQAAISDQQFLKSMIPHHGGAILMCERASIRDPEVRGLCRSIILGQQAEIDQMKAKLRELQK